MINFSGISSKNIIGRLLRFPFKLIPNEMRMPILQGRLKGKKWIVGSSNYGCWLGSYEYEKQILFSKTITEGAVVYDIGAHVGFYTLLASEIVGPKGKVVAFEPLHRNIRYLNKHLQLNRCKNVIMIEAAVTERSGITFFEKSKNYHMGRVSLKGSIEVKTVSLDNLVLKNEIPPPDYMKIDVEGAETLVLFGAEKLIRKFNPAIFLATHGQEVHKQCCEFLKSVDYEMKSINHKGIDKTDEIVAFKK